ncbi:MAG: PQQ-binding-like beta-propeller repeat protein [Haloferacaceae archaeon]
MPDADPGRSNYAPGAAGPTDRVAKLWEVAVDTGLSVPVFADETLYVGGDDGRIRALDARTGDRRWRRSVGAPADAPWVVGEHLYVPTADGIVALVGGDGDERWRTPTPDRVGVVVAAHGVYWLAEGDPPAVVALARSDGGERWRTELGDPWERPLFASAGRVFVSSGTHDFRFWTLDAGTGDLLGEEPRSGNDFPAERFYRNGTVYAADPFFGNVRASAVTESGHGWSQGVEAVGRFAMSGDDERVYYLATADDGPGLYALSATDGSVAWTADVATERACPPVVADETVLVRTGDALRCLDPADGTDRWTLPGTDVGERVVVADDLVYTTADGAVRAFRPP